MFSLLSNILTHKIDGWTAIDQFNGGEHLSLYFFEESRARPLRLHKPKFLEKGKLSGWELYVRGN